MIRCTVGQQAADYILRQVVDSVMMVARRYGGPVRYGEGEVFAVALSDLDRPGAESFAEKIRTRVERATWVFEDRIIPATISTGVVGLDASVQSAEELLETAERSLYAASAGRGT